jgi:dihydroorotase
MTRWSPAAGVVDPRNGIRAVRDVGIRDHKIAAIENEIAPRGPKVINARGLLVTPGLVDIHT